MKYVLTVMISFCSLSAPALVVSQMKETDVQGFMADAASISVVVGVAMKSAPVILAGALIFDDKIDLSSEEAKSALTLEALADPSEASPVSDALAKQWGVTSDQIKDAVGSLISEGADLTEASIREAIVKH